MQTPFSLRIFVADGDPDGLRIVDKSNWIGKALVFPRALIEDTIANAARHFVLHGQEPKHDMEPSGNKVYFDFDSFDVRDEFRPLIGRYAGQMQASTKRVLVIEGYADERGSREYNLALGQKRAGAVLQALQAQGVPRQRMEAISWGEERPADPGHNEVAWARNRRAELNMRNR